jgi:DNA-directed RNA polymerase specialized sigma24 family protein
LTDSIIRKTIGERLENWARWATARATRGADSMTGAICESMRKAALGNVWSGHDVRDETDEQDAVAIEIGMRSLSTAQRALLWWCYIKQQHPGFIARKMSFPVAEFVNRFRDAQDAIEDAADTGNR